MNIKLNNETNTDCVVSENKTAATKADNTVVSAPHGNQAMLNNIAQRFASAKVENRSQMKHNDVEQLRAKGQISDKKSSTNGILQKKKTFPLKISTSAEKNVKALDKSEVDKIVCQVNNKIYRGGANNNDTISSPQKVTFKSPVQIFRPNSAYVNKYRGNENEAKDKATNERNHTESNQTESQPDNSSAVLKYQVKQLVARWIIPMLVIVVSF